MWPAVKLSFSQEGFAEYVSRVKFGAWRPSLIVWHNTAAPTLAQWQASAAADRAAGRVPGSTRIANLETYFWKERKWSGAPHLFIADDLIWVFNPLTAPGVHSPSWNSFSIGIEMVADFDREDDDAGAGLKVRNNTIFATAVLCETFGLDPLRAIKLHREDPRTTHACPGEDFARDKAAAVAAVAALLPGGEHAAELPAPRAGTVKVNGLNIRSGPGARNAAVGQLNKGDRVSIADGARNGETEWLRLAGDEARWVAGNYVQLEK